MKKTLFDGLSASFLIGFTSLLFLSKGEILFNIGGSLGLVPLIGILYYISLIKKHYNIPLKIFSLICWCLIVLSYFAYREATGGLTSEIIIASVTFLVILNFLFCLLIFQFIKKPDISSPLSIELWKRGAGLLYFRLLSPITIYVIGTVIVFWSYKNDRLIVEHTARFLPTILLLMIAFYAFSLVKLKKAEGNAFRYFFMGEQNIDEINVIWKHMSPIVLIVIVLANFIEFIRGMWFLNLFTWILFICILLYIRRFLENLLKRSTEDIAKTEVNLDLLPSLSNPNFFRKTIVFHAVFGVLYLVSLGLLILLLGK